MTKKRNRDRVIAEITLFHLMRLANEQGCSVSHERVMAFLNEEERAQAMWNHMMQAGLEFVAFNLFPTALVHRDKELPSKSDATRA